VLCFEYGLGLLSSFHSALVERQREGGTEGERGERGERDRKTDRQTDRQNRDGAYSTVQYVCIIVRLVVCSVVSQVVR